MVPISLFHLAALLQGAFTPKCITCRLLLASEQSFVPHKAAQIRKVNTLLWLEHLLKPVTVFHFVNHASIFIRLLRGAGGIFHYAEKKLLVGHGSSIQPSESCSRKETFLCALIHKA